MKINLIVRPTASGVYARSPQCRGLVVGRPSVEDLKNDLDDILAFYFNRPGPFDVLGHEENVREIDGMDIVLRCATDEHYRARTTIADRVIAALRDSTQRADLLSYPTDKVGEIVFIAVLANDTLGWIASQLDDSGEPAVIAAPVGEGLIWTNVVSYGDPDGSKMEQLSETAADLPNGSDTTVGQMMLDAPLLRPTGRSLVYP